MSRIPPSSAPPLAALALQVLCTACHPYSIHLYERLGTGLTMTSDYCKEFYEKCSAPDQLDLDEGYCAVHVGDGEDEYWSYPLIVNGEDRVGNQWKPDETQRFRANTRFRLFFLSSLV